MKTSSTIALTAAAVALVAAGSTAGYAGAKVTSASIKNNTITSADIKNGAINRGDLDPGLVRSVSVGRAYATVTRVETATGMVAKLDAKRSYGFSKLRHAPDTDGFPNVGVYCLTPAPGVDLSRSAIIVSGDFSLTAGIATVLWDSQGQECSAKEIEVRTLTDQGDDEPSPSDEVAFQVLAS